jgi:cysteinyl-tRNA synthetase
VNSCSEGHQTVTESQIKELKHLFNDYALVILGLKEEASDSATGQLTDQLMSFILSLRAEARQKKDFATSDKIRDTLASLNVQIKDTKEGATWTYEQ